MPDGTLSLATSFEDKLIDGIKDLPVSHLYGKVESDGFGGGRPRFLVPKIGWNRFRRHVEHARAHGIAFDYLLNAADGGTGDVATPGGYRRLRTLLDRLVESGVEWVTVVSPLFLRIIVKNTPLKVRVSVFARVDDERKALAWFSEGAHRIVLDSMLVNRDPERLRRLARAVGSLGELELLVNNRCELGCAWAPCHAVDLGASSRRPVPAPDSCYFQCHTGFLKEPARLLMQDWIRPEDLPHYEALGYRHFKLAGRGCTTEELIVRARAYSERHYEGNLMDLLRRGKVQIDAPTALSAAFRAGWRRLLGLSRAAGPALDIEDKIEINNRALDGYLDLIFRKGGCLPGKCWRCDLCSHWAERAVSFPDDLANRVSKVDEGLVTGALWNLSG